MAVGDVVQKELISQSRLGASLASQYAAPANNTSQITTIYLANTDLQNDKTVFLARSANAKNVLMPKITVPKGQCVVISFMNKILQATQALYAKATGQTTGTAQAGTSSTITLASGASSTDSYYVGQVIELTGGQGSGQSATISAYVGATKTATVDVAWGTVPNNTTTYEIGGVYMTADGIEEVVS